MDNEMLITLTADIVSAHLSNNPITAEAVNRAGFAGGCLV
ncbi:MucR family transcriptional regulator [Novosphingobium terrae]|nr:MucR family transcriptional regulator [Novosphingobium terrae]